MNPNDQTGILSSIVPDSLTVTQTGGVDPLLQGIGNIPQLDFNKLYQQRQEALKEFAPPVRTAEQIQTELQDIYGADPTSARNARFAALGQFGGDLAASQAPNIFQAFTQAAPAFSQNLANIRAKERAFQQQLQLEADKTARAEEAQRRAFNLKLASDAMSRQQSLQDSLFTAQLKLKSQGIDSITETFADIANPSMPLIDIITDKRTQKRFVRNDEGQLVPFVAQAGTNYVKATSEMINDAFNRSFGNQPYTEDGQVTRAFGSALKEADAFPIQVADTQDDRTNPKLISTVQAKDLGPQFGGIVVQDPDNNNQWRPVGEVYPFFSLSPRSELVTDTSNKYRNSVVLNQDIIIGEGEDAEVFGANTHLVYPKTKLGDAFLINNKGERVQVPNMYDETYKNNNEEGKFFGEEKYSIVGLESLTEKQAEAAKEDIQLLERALSELQDVIGTGDVLKGDQNKDLFGAWNGLRATLGNKFAAPLSAFILGDVAAQKISNEDVGKVRSVFALINRTLVRAELIGARGAVYEQELLKELFKAKQAEGFKLLADFTTMDQLLALEDYLTNRINRVRQVFRTTDMPLIEADPLAKTSFTKNDNPTLNIAYREIDGVQYAIPASDDPSDYTQDNMGLIARFLESSLIRDKNDFRLIPANDLKNILQTKFITVGRSTASAFGAPSLAGKTINLLEALPILGYSTEEIRELGLSPNYQDTSTFSGSDRQRRNRN